VPPVLNGVKEITNNEKRKKGELERKESRKEKKKGRGTMMEKSDR